MNNDNKEAKEIIQRIIQEERERREQIEKLEQELNELEEDDEMCDTKKIVEIIDELNIINPLPESDENAKAMNPIKKNRQRRYIFLKISAACVAIIISTQIVVMATFDINLLGSAYEWTKETFLSLIGVEIQQDDINLEISSSTIYNTIEEFENDKNVSILVPMWLPNDSKIELLIYSEDNEYKMLNIWYDDGFSSVLIYFNAKFIDYDTLDNYEIYYVNGIDFYIFKDVQTIQWVYKGDTYTLTCNFIESESTQIINNIK